MQGKCIGEIDFLRGGGKNVLDIGRVGVGIVSVFYVGAFYRGGRNQEGRRMRIEAEIRKGKIDEYIK